MVHGADALRPYWTVRPEEEEVEVYRKPSADEYAERTVVATPGILYCSALKSVSVNLAKLFA